MLEQIKDISCVNAGDVVYFTYGIPPISVYASVVEMHGELIMLTPGHNPEEALIKEALELGCNIYLVSMDDV